MTSTTLRPRRTVPGWLKTGLLAALVFALCWGGAIAWWQSAGSEPGAGDLALMLLALPCGLLLVLRLGTKFVLPRPAVPAAATRPAPGASTPAASAPLLAILATALRSPHGASAEELAAAIADGKARGDLDPELVDDKGFPITTARREDAADEASQEEIHDWLAANNMADIRFSDAQWRALTLGTAVVRDLAGHAASELLPMEGWPSTLRLIPILPATWTVEQRTSASAWFKHVIAQFGWPPASVMCVDILAAMGSAPSSVLSQFAFQASSASSHLTALIIACESNIDQETADRWETDGVLFTPARLQGLIPGEGAAGLLLTDLGSIKSQPDAVYAQLDPFVEVRRDTSIDENKRTDMTPLAGLVEQACKQAAIEISAVGMIVADTGERANRTLELMGLASSALPQLESSSDVACVGASSGTCGAVPYLTALALAHHHALERAAPALCMSNEDSHHRCATLVRPASLQS
ncbi:hypothetical protein [Massilia niabensis]|uniref:3-oxoacyl-ACP synthase n=1 Tax=Massilia niabensis TaxID=544910 RepID=A0ABW0L2W8_9BURK